MNISIYDNIKDVKTNKNIPIDIFFDRIRTGYWQDLVLPMRAIRDKAARQEAKKKLPNVTISGIFPSREDKACKLHSGLIAVDLDDIVGIDSIKAMLSHDPYVYAIFVSVSGMGLCVVFQIEADKHRDAFAGIADYLIKKYQILVDPSGVNPSRARYVSFDPHLYMNHGAIIFKKYLPKEQRPKQVPVIFVRSEFEAIIKQMVERNVSCVDDYREWLKVSFGLADEFGEAGRVYFHQLSSCSNKYDSAMCDKQYNHALKRNGKLGIKVTIATIYYYAKQAGIPIIGEKTRKISSATTSLKKSGLSKETIIGNLEKFEGIKPEDSTAIVNQAFDSGADYHDKDTLVDNVIQWLKHTYQMRRNIITRRIEISNKTIDDLQLNTMYIDAKRVFNELSFELFTKCIFSHKTSVYNPFTEWYDQNKNLPYNDEINRLWDCLKTDDTKKLREFGTRWLVSIIASIYGEPSPLFLLLCGERHGTGKTRAFRYMLPDEWRGPVDYYAESKLDAGKDDDILMTQKLLIMDDEFDGKSKAEQRRFKALTDKDTFSIREPYGRIHTDMKRLAVLCGTSQASNILSDPTGNRRIIPVRIITIDLDSYKKIDKSAMFAELFRMYHQGFEWRVFGDDMDKLNASTEEFIDFSIEYELINEMFKIPDANEQSQELTASEIKVKIDMKSGQRTNLNKIGAELKRMGFVQTIKKVNKKTARVYMVNECGTGLLPFIKTKPVDDGPEIKEDFTF